MRKVLFLGIVLSMFYVGAKGMLVGKQSRISEGKMVPELVVANGDSIVSLRSMSGKYVLVDFWSSSDANSRLRSNEYDGLDLAENGDIERISVNFDRSRRLFDEIISRDNLDASTQFHVNGDIASRIKHDFSLNEGFKSLLVSPEGRIVAVNPKASDIASLVG